MARPISVPRSAAIDDCAGLGTNVGMRMMMYVVILLLVGCGAVQSDEPDSSVRGVQVTEVAAPAQAAAASAVIVATYERLVGVDMSGVQLRIRWSESLPGGLLGSTEHGGSGCSTWIVSGAMFAYPKVLPHEIAHCVRWLMTGDGDPEHADATWWGHGGFVEQAHAAEAAAGY